MPTIDEMYADLEQADASGDYELARVIASRIKSAQAKPQPAQKLPTPAEAAMGGAKRGVASLAGGALRGAGSIGSTIVAPGDYLSDMIFGEGKETRNAARRREIDEGMRDILGADTDSFGYQFGKIGTEVAGTLGVPLALGGKVAGIAPVLGKAIQTGGMVGPNLATRVAGGAAAGGASAGLADPEYTTTGAVIGGALPAAIPAAKFITRKAGNLAAETFGLTTGSGAESIRQAAKAGMAGGERAKSFTANMRGDAPMSDALDIAKSNLDAMRAAKNAQYRSGMVDIRNDRAVIDFADVDQALSDAANVTLYKGQVKSAKAESVRAEIAKAVDEWKSLDPAEYHTPEGFDALKQRIGAIVESIPMEERTAGKVGKDIYNAVKNAITRQAPTYAKVMQDYSQAADDIAQAEKALSLGKKSSVDTAMRKLQSLMRNNVNTNYGNRLAIAEQLQREGGQDFMPALAGQSLSSITPRGLQSVVASGAGAAGYLSGGIPGAAAAIPLLAAQSPRIVGEAAYGVGRAAGVGGNLIDALFQSRAVPVSGASILDMLQNR